jgi:hypothetical protein
VYNLKFGDTKFVKRQTVKIKWTDKITNEELWRMTQKKSIENQIKKKKMELD